MTKDSNRRPAGSGFEMRWRLEPTPGTESAATRGVLRGLRSPGGVGPGVFDIPVQKGAKPPCDEPTDSSS
jgi:hypothetical protein